MFTKERLESIIMHGKRATGGWTVVPLLTMGLFSNVRVFAQSNSFGPVSVPGTAVIFDPDNVLTAEQLADLRSAGTLSPTPAVKAFTFLAAPGQTFTFSASGLVGCCSTANIGPDGYPNDRANITSLGSISGIVSPNGLPLVGVFTNGSPSGAAPSPYDYSAGLGQASFSPSLNQVFVIGDGLTGTGSGSKQVFNVPATATELWLGFTDAGTFNGPPANYGDNAGSEMVVGTLSTNSCAPTAPSGISWETLATVPNIDNKSRHRIGVGESVKLTSNSDVTWTIMSSSGEGTLRPDITAVPPEEFRYSDEGFPTEQCSGAPSSEIFGRQACFVAPNKNSSIEVTATLNGSSCSMTFTTVRPESLLFQRLQVPKDSLDYELSYHGFYHFETFRVVMESVAFVIPGDVSFANVIFQENDHDPPHTDRRYNWLSTIRTLNNGIETGRTNAWLLGCDFDAQQERVGDPPAGFDAFFAYRILKDREEGLREGPPIIFSLVQTAWSLVNDKVRFSKKQFGNFSADGSTFELTPGLPAADLEVRASGFNDFVPVVDQPGAKHGSACLNYVQQQFPLLPSSLP
jgi:hypothetical protein